MTAPLVAGGRTVGSEFSSVFALPLNSARFYFWNSEMTLTLADRPDKPGVNSQNRSVLTALMPIDKAWMSEKPLSGNKHLHLPFDQTHCPPCGSVSIYSGRTASLMLKL